MLVLGECCCLWLIRFFCGWEVWSMHYADTQCTVKGREEAKGQKKIFMFKFFFSCHKIWILFHTMHHRLTSDLRNPTSSSSLHRRQSLINTLHTKLHLSTASEPPACDIRSQKQSTGIGIPINDSGHTINQRRYIPSIIRC